jgi:hypothetical protein
MNKERLLKLADLLEADAANPIGLKFDLGVWGTTEPDDFHDDAPPAPPVSISCGTSACAMGLAVLSGAFADAGLFNGSFSKSRIVPEMRASGACGFDAAAELFDIDETSANHLFDAACYPRGKRTGAEGERDVAARIREFVADNSPEDTTV